MRRIAFLAPLAAVVLASTASANQPTSTVPPQVTVTIGGDLIDEVENLGERDVQLRIDDLTQTVQRTLARRGALNGARVDLVLTDLKPNRPTIQQTSDKPGLSAFHSISIGGAAVEGQITTADGQVMPIDLSRYSSNITEVRGYSTWQDADRAFDLIARRIADGQPTRR